MASIDLTKKKINILGAQSFYNKKLENEEKFIRYVGTIEKALKLWKMEDFTVKGKITIFRRTLSKNQTKYKNNLFGMETTQKLNTPLYVTNMTKVA